MLNTHTLSLFLPLPLSLSHARARWHAQSTAQRCLLVACMLALARSRACWRAQSAAGTAHARVRFRRRYGERFVQDLHLLAGLCLRSSVYVYMRIFEYVHMCICVACVVCIHV